MLLSCQTWIEILLHIQELKSHHAAELQQAVAAEQEREAAVKQQQVASEVQSQLSAWQVEHDAVLTKLKADHTALLRAAVDPAGSKLAALHAEHAAQKHAVRTEAAAEKQLLQEVGHHAEIRKSEPLCWVTASAHISVLLISHISQTDLHTCCKASWYIGIGAKMIEGDMMVMSSIVHRTDRLIPQQCFVALCCLHECSAHQS